MTTEQQADRVGKAIVDLTEEMKTIHSANNLYWKQGETHSKEAKAEYHRRNDRLEEIRNELTRLRAGLVVMMA
jgi:hypothetical protein